MRHGGWILRMLLVVLGVALAAAGRAQTLPRLPEAFSFPLGDGSPGQVVFIHETHVDQQKPACTACHPSLFKILAKGEPAEGGVIDHDEMGRGKQCGACHNGRAAFGIDDADNCTACHRASGP